VIVTFDITDRESFDSINYWMQNMEQTTDVTKLTIVLVGNKSDLEQKRQIKREEGEELAKKYNIHYYESSAKTSSNVNEIFSEVAAKII
jgi:small GTP-binding protein